MAIMCAVVFGTVFAAAGRNGRGECGCAGGFVGVQVADDADGEVLVSRDVIWRVNVSTCITVYYTDTKRKAI